MLIAMFFYYIYLWFQFMTTELAKYVKILSVFWYFVIVFFIKYMKLFENNIICLFVMRQRATNKTYCYESENNYENS